MFDTNFAFAPGKLTVTLDGGAGSSGKGKLGSFLCEHAKNWQFACNTFMPQAAHWVKLDNGQEYLYKTLNSCAYLGDRYEKLYIAPGATVNLAQLNQELWENKVPRKKIGISPLTAILQEIDGGFERGICDIDGSPTGGLSAIVDSANFQIAVEHPALFTLWLWKYGVWVVIFLATALSVSFVTSIARRKPEFSFVDPVYKAVDETP
jgi:hypothetical protein